MKTFKYYCIYNVITILITVVLYNVQMLFSSIIGDRQIEILQILIFTIFLSSSLLNLLIGFIRRKNVTHSQAIARFAAIKASAVLARYVILAMLATDIMYFYLFEKHSSCDLPEWDESCVLFEMGVIIRLPLLLVSVLIRIKSVCSRATSFSTLGILTQNNLSIASYVSVGWIILSYATGIKNMYLSYFIFNNLLFIPLSILSIISIYKILVNNARRQKIVSTDSACVFLRTFLIVFILSVIIASVILWSFTDFFVVVKKLI